MTKQHLSVFITLAAALLLAVAPAAAITEARPQELATRLVTTAGGEYTLHIPQDWHSLQSGDRLLISSPPNPETPAAVGELQLYISFEPLDSSISLDGFMRAHLPTDGSITGPLQNTSLGPYEGVYVEDSTENSDLLLVALRFDGVALAESITPPGRMDEYRPQIMAALATLERPAVAAPVPWYTHARYEGLPQDINAQGYPTLGQPDAPVLLEDFSSFSCIFCYGFHHEVFPELLGWVEEGELFFIYIPIYTTGSVPNGFDANRAALCAGQQGHFWQYADLLFDWHGRFANAAFTAERLEQGARNLGLDMDAWTECMSTPEPEQVLTDALRDMAAAGITGTPGILVNGQPVAASLNAINSAIRDIIGERI